MTATPGRPLVLMVEDDEDTREMYTLVLESSGMCVLTATSVDAAFALAVERQPDVIVTDFLLQGGGTGADLCRRLRADRRTSSIPALLLTGSSLKSHAEAALGAGCAELRLKPHLPDMLVTDVQHLVERRQGAAQP